MSVSGSFSIDNRPEIEALHETIKQQIKSTRWLTAVIIGLTVVQVATGIIAVI